MFPRFGGEDRAGFSIFEITRLTPKRQHMNSNEEAVRQFIQAIEQRKEVATLQSFYHPDIGQIEFPNLLTGKTVSRTLNDITTAFEKGKQVLQSEKYVIEKLYTAGDAVILEATWTGVLAIPIGKLPKGGEMKAYFAQIYEFAEGKIVKQRNYDCFEPFL